MADKTDDDLLNELRSLGEQAAEPVEGEAHSIWPIGHPVLPAKLPTPSAASIEGPSP
jgi:hypothetical protein